MNEPPSTHIADTSHTTPAHVLWKDLLKILVVDDAPMMRQRIIESLMETGTTRLICLAEDVRSALDAMREVEPQIVLLDIHMPGSTDIQNGIELLRWIKQARESTHVVMLTNLSDPAYREAARRLGAYAFLDKSLEFGQLPGIIKTLSQLTQKDKLP
jgi:DNA-binding NarL/FixJ family response regulator